MDDNSVEKPRIRQERLADPSQVAHFLAVKGAGGINAGMDKQKSAQFDPVLETPEEPKMTLRYDPLKIVPGLAPCCGIGIIVRRLDAVG